jgi:hypothetical protein
MKDNELRALLIDLARQVRESLQEPLPADLTPSQRRILAALTDTPTPARQLARLANRTYNSRFRDQLAELVRRRLVRHLPEGYSRP